MPRTSWALLSSAPGFAPPLTEQRRIAEILDTVDDAIRTSERIIAKLKGELEGMEQAFFAEAWAKGSTTLGDVAQVERGKFSVRPRDDPSYYGGAYPFVQTGDVARSSRGPLTEFSQTLNELGTSVSRSFPAGTIAVTIAANIADTAVLEREMFFPDSVVGVMVQPPNQIRWVEMCIYAAKRTLDARAPQSAQKNINLQELRPLRIPNLDPQEQSRLAAIWSTAHKRIQLEQAGLRKLRATRTGLAADLLSSRVRTVAS